MNINVFLKGLISIGTLSVIDTLNNNIVEFIFDIVNQIMGERANVNRYVI